MIRLHADPPPPPSGDTTPVSIGGRVYHAHRWSYGIQRAFEQRLKQRATEDTLETMRTAGLTPQERQEFWATLQSSFAAGKYAFGSQVWHEALLNDPQALARLLWLQLATAQPELTEATVLEWTHDPELRGECYEAVFAANPQWLQKAKKMMERATTPPGAQPTEPASTAS